MIKDKMHIAFALALLAGCGANEEVPSTGSVAHPLVSAAEVAAYGDAHALLQQHCLICHSEKPAMPGYTIAPAGVVLETPEQLGRLAPRVLAVVELQMMPPLNMTSMTHADRQTLAAVIRKQWASQL